MTDALISHLISAVAREDCTSVVPLDHLRCGYVSSSLSCIVDCCDFYWGGGQEPGLFLITEVWLIHSVLFMCIANWSSYIYIFFFRLFSIIGFYKTSSIVSSLCYIVGPCYSSVLGLFLFYTLICFWFRWVCVAARKLCSNSCGEWELLSGSGVQALTSVVLLLQRTGSRSEL